MSEEALSKEQFRELLGHMGLATKSAALLMWSSGIRIGEAMKLKIDDLHLDEDPPYADVRAVYTMGGYGRHGRRAHFSYEARDSIEEWLKVKEIKVKKIIEELEELVFGYGRGTWRYQWNKAREKINSGATAHTLRKCFFMNMARVGVPETILRVFMGFRPDLDLHSPISTEYVAKVYKEHIHAVSIYEAEEAKPIE